MSRESKEISERLRTEYKAAFEEWVAQVNRYHQSANRKEAEARIAAAERAYRNSRDKLTDEMVTDCPETVTQD